MTEQDQAPAGGAGTGGGEAEAAQAPQIRVLAQYIRDLSFENPGAPNTLMQAQTQPDVSVGIDVKARSLQAQGGAPQDTFECALQIQCSAKRGDDTLFIIELMYCGLFALNNVGKENINPIMLIEAPRLLFPFARQIIADMTRTGGFMPLMLDPIDFAALYRHQLAEAAKQQDGNGGSADAPQANGKDTSAPSVS